MEEASVAAIEPMTSDLIDVADPRRSAMVDLISRRVEPFVLDHLRSEVHRMVAEELALYEDARITEYIPIFVERAVLRRLRAQIVIQGGIGT
jgi:hypothetical protein